MIKSITSRIGESTLVPLSMKDSFRKNVRKIKKANKEYLKGIKKEIRFKQKNTIERLRKAYYNN